MLQPATCSDTCRPLEINSFLRFPSQVLHKGCFKTKWDKLQPHKCEHEVLTEADRFIGRIEIEPERQIGVIKIIRRENPYLSTMVVAQEVSSTPVFTIAFFVVGDAERLENQGRDL